MSKFSINNPAWLQMACVKIKKGQGISYIYSGTAMLGASGISGVVTVEFLKNGIKKSETYNISTSGDIQDVTMISIDADVDSNVVVIPNSDLLVAIGGSREINCNNLTIGQVLFASAAAVNVINSHGISCNLSDNININITDSYFDFIDLGGSSTNSIVTVGTDAKELMLSVLHNITNIDLSSFRSLEIFSDINCISMTEYDFSSCKQIQKINLGANLDSLKKLNISGLSNLQYLLIEDLTHVEEVLYSGTNNVGTIQIYYPNELLANALIDIINQSTISNGTLYAKYPTYNFVDGIISAATAKGWNVVESHYPS